MLSPTLSSFLHWVASHRALLLNTQVPGTHRLLQQLGGALYQPNRGIAQPARQMEEQQEASVRTSSASQSAVDYDPSRAAPIPYTPPQGMKKTFYKRKLPCPPATEFSSTEGRLLFAEALQQGTMNGFFKLIEQYSTQDEPAFCGLASIAMVLNALSIDPKRPWKGSWRWFHEQLLDCCLPLDTVAQEGVVLTQAACLAKCNGANVALHRAGTFSLEELRQAVVDVCSSGEEHLVVSYSRKTFSQTGDGHFSPVGGYHAGRDLVLILDTARFKYPPHWVPLPMLYESMSAVDPSTGKPRGFLRMSVNTRPDSVLFTLDIRPDGTWRDAERYIRTTAPELVKAAAASGQLTTPESVLGRLIALAPLDSVQSFIAVRFAAQLCARDRCVPHTVRQQVLQELRAAPLYQIIQPILERWSSDQQQQQLGVQGNLSGAAGAAAVDYRHVQHHQQQFLAEKLTMLLLLQEPAAWGPAEAWADQQQLKQWQQLLDASSVSIVEGEVQYLRRQLLHIDAVLQEDRGTVNEATGSCSTCAFQLDCSVKGCIKGELQLSSYSSAPTAAAQEGAQQQHQQQQQQQHEGSRTGCCGHGGNPDDNSFAAGHACCS